MTIVTKWPAQCLRMYACLLTALLCLNMPVSCCLLSMLRSSCICLAYPPYASGRSLLLYCFRHWVHHPCPRTSARVWATKRKQATLLAKRYPPLQGYRKFLQVYWSETSMYAHFLDCGGKISSKNFDLGMFGNIGFASFPIDWCELWWLSTLHSIAIELSNVSNGLLSDHIVTRSLKWKFEISHSINESYKRLLSCHIIVHFHQKQNKWNSYGVSP